MLTRLVENGKSDYKVVVSAQASPSERLAAKEFVSFIKQITGAELPVAEDTAPEEKHEVLIGYTARECVAYGKVSLDQCGDEGFIIKADGEKLVIAGGRLRGTLYGVYTFLEDYTGCRWFTPKLSRIPKKSDILIPEISRFEKPALEYREPYFYEVTSGGQEWSVRNKCNGSSVPIDEEHGGHVRYGAFVHTFSSIIPPKEYAKTHPEYFSMIDGQRVTEHSQLCLTNPEVLRLTVEKVREWISKRPDCKIFSVSQNDWGNYCTCPACAAVDEEEESHAGSLLRFVNAVAEAIEKEYPDVLIDTLAYQYTRKAPKHVKPRKNVVVRLCSIECCELHPVSECHVTINDNKSPSGNPFAVDLAEWKKICERLYIWDYSANFHLYLYPHPTLQVFAPNMRFFVENNVKGVFHEGSDGKGGGGYCAELKAYLMAKLIWDPYCDAKRHEAEFLCAYYGLAAYKMKEIFDAILRSALDCGGHLFFAMAASQEFTKKDDNLVVKCKRLFEEAELMAENDEILERIKRARMWLLLLEITKLQVGEPGRAELIDMFEKRCEEFGYEIMGCAPTMTVKELCDYLRVKSDMHP